MSKQLIGVLALLVSSAGYAATVTVTPSTLTPNSAVNEVFTVSVAVANVANVGGITMAMSWDSTKASLTSSSLPAFGTGPLAIGTGTFLIVNGAGNSRTIDILPGAPPVNGNFDLAVFTFTALAAGAMNLVINDDGGIFTGWFDNDTAEVIPVDYTQANVQIGPAPVVPVPAAAWLLISALGSMVALKRRPL